MRTQLACARNWDAGAEPGFILLEGGAAL